jgi:DEAD/DEAH box helicase domain-containing protein
LKKGCDAKLDLSPEELIVGLHPKRQNQLPTASVFISDALENGAGYAVEIGHPKTFRDVLETIELDLNNVWGESSHSARCTSSCPDCLRSYNNRRIHGFLDWRLAIDTVELALGKNLNLSRWFAGAKDELRGLTQHADHLEYDLVQGLPILINTQRNISVVFGHPLWSIDREHLSDLQKQVELVLASRGLIVEHANFFDASRKPIAILRLLGAV